jgi:uncharacterized protein with GYD domain
VKEVPKRAQAARDLAKKLGVEIKQVYLTSGESDLLIIVETANGDNITKFAMALGSLGNVRTRTVRAWPEAEMAKFIFRASLELGALCLGARQREHRRALSPAPADASASCRNATRVKPFDYGA